MSITSDTLRLCWHLSLTSSKFRKEIGKKEIVVCGSCLFPPLLIVSLMADIRSPWSGVIFNIVRSSQLCDITWFSRRLFICFISRPFVSFCCFLIHRFPLSNSYSSCFSSYSSNLYAPIFFYRFSCLYYTIHLWFCQYWRLVLYTSIIFYFSKCW